MAKRRLELQRTLEMLKAVPHDKVKYKADKKRILAEMNALTFDINEKVKECYQQNHDVVRMMLMMFVGMDFLTRLYDEAADLFKAVTVGVKRDELLDFTKMCREVATQANKVVQIIDEAGKDAMSMAYAGMEDGIGETMLDQLRDKIEAYGETPEGRKYFYGDNLKR